VAGNERWKPKERWRNLDEREIMCIASFCIVLLYPSFLFMIGNIVLCHLCVTTFVAEIWMILFTCAFL